MSEDDMKSKAEEAAKLKLGEGEDPIEGEDGEDPIEGGDEGGEEVVEAPVYPPLYELNAMYREAAARRAAESNE